MNVEIPKLNVPVGIYLISLVAIAIGEKYGLCITKLAGIISGIVSLASIIFCLIPYTINYMRNKNSTKK